MRVHWFQHVPFEGLGSMQAWFDEAGYTLSKTGWFAGDAAPGVDDYDWLIVMGGPMGVADEGQHPWLREEKSAIRAALDAGKPILGICLGAQLIAHVLGAEVAPNGHKEIGWFPVRLTQNAALSPFFADFPEVFDAFHWHGDRFNCPRRGLRMARSEACDQQAFVFNERVLGLQFHLETTEASAAALIEHCGDELVPAPGVMQPAQMLGDAQRFEAINRLMAALLARMAEQAERLKA